MNGDRRRFLSTAAVLAAAGAAGVLRGKTFLPHWDSLGRYRAPEWFRDAKLGFWGQWSPQSVPEQGDWYAHNMYVEGSRQYRHHLAHYGHPSRFGYKDLCRNWRGARWDPAALLDFYRQAGARYFVALGNHCDGFDCWDSRYQRWNAVNWGPRKDIVGGWAAAARACGLRFGVSLFAAQNWDWMAVAHGADRSGPQRGVPYDGTLVAAQGAGTWWAGYDPQALYGPPHAPGAPASAAFIANFFARARDLAERYRPDQIFFSDQSLPFGQAGLDFAADFYNAGAVADGRVETVINTKHVTPGRESALVWDRLPVDQLQAAPWQMDICIGDWHYQRGLAYRTAADVVPYWVDVVSKNGNLLVNVPIREDGTIDEAERAFVAAIGEWNKINGEAIFDTRPWRRWGEGPSPTPAVDFPFRKIAYGADDIRFTAKGDTLYAIALAWPASGRLEIKSLRQGAAERPEPIAHVALLGADRPVRWQRTESALSIWLPPTPPCSYAYAFKILST